MTEILLAIWILWLSYRIGTHILHFMHIFIGGILEIYLYSTGLGLGFFAILIFCLGQLNLIYPAFLIFLMLSITFIFILLKLPFSFSPSNLINHLNHKFRSIHIALYIVMGIAVFINLLGTLTPELRHDSLQYHVSIPHNYILFHKMLDVPYSIYHFYSLNMEMLYTLALLLNGAALGKLIHASMAVLAAVGIYCISKRYFQSPVPLMSAALFYTLPQVAWMSSTTFNENGWMFYGVLSMMSWLNWWNTQNKQWLYLTALFSGLGITMKLVVIAFYPFILGITTLFIIIYKRKQHDIPTIVLYWIVILLPVIPWIIRNYIYTLNPFFPLLSNIFPSYSDYTVAGNAFHNIRQLPLFSFTAFLKRMLDAFYFIQINGNSMLGLFSLVLLGAFIQWKTLPRELRFLVYYCLFAWIVYNLIEGGLDGRFIYPTYPFMAIVTAFILWNLLNPITRLRNYIVWVFCIFILSTYLYGKYTFYLDFCESPLPVLRSSSVDKYLSEYIQFYPVYKYVNQNLPEDVHILLPAGYGAFYCNRKYIANSEFDLSPFTKLIASGQSPEIILKNLDEWKISHLIISRHWTEMPENSGILPSFIKKYTKNIYQTNQFTLLKIKPDGNDF